jgi:glutamate-1-semialdehyde 2,1-aminomutase
MTPRERPSIDGADGTATLGRQEALLEEADRVLATGGLAMFALPPEVNLVVARGRGSRVVDADGREYVDYHLGSGPNLLGHAHPAVTEAVAAQLPRGTSFYFLNEPIIRLARRIVEAVPCGEQVHFTGSGSEATFFALRVARAYTGRSKLLKFEGAWHGMHDYALWGTVPEVPSDYPRARPDSAGIPGELAETVLVAPFNETERAVATIERHAAELAAVVVEPLQRVLRPEPGFLEALREVTARHGIVLVFDEVVTGFRLAWGGAQEAYGVQPDLAAYGKAIGGGFPIAAVVGRSEYLAPLDPRRTPRDALAWASGTFNGNPVAAAAGNAALDVLSRPGTYERLRQVGARLRRGLREAGRRHGFAVQTPGEDAVFGVRFMENERPRTWTDLAAADRALGRAWAVECIRRGVLVNPNEKLYLSIAHTDADVDRTLAVAEEAFRALARSADRA